MNRIKSIVLALFLLGAVPDAGAEIWMPAIFSDGMVLQQDTSVKLWGKVDRPSSLTIRTSWDGEKYSVTPDKEGNWSVMVKTLKADMQPYSFTVAQGKDKKSFTDVLFGEVWLCAGQSNMEMYMKGYQGKPVIGGPLAIANSKNDYIRLFNVQRSAQYEPQEDCAGEWKYANPENVANFSAIAYFFGRQLFQSLQVPVALITAPWGAATIEAFISREAIKIFPSVRLPKNQEDLRPRNRTATAIFNGMINPLVGYGIKGVIWYQGESNRVNTEMYCDLYKTMLADWRSRWNIGDFPFIYAQIAPYGYHDRNTAYLREQQFRAQKECKNTYMVSLLDVGEEKDIHPCEKFTPAFRMAQTALSKTYGIKGIVSDAPEFKSMVVNGSRVRMFFDNAEGGLTTYGAPLDGFYVAGEDRFFYPATKAYYYGKVIVVESDRVKKPVAVRYGFVNYFKGMVYNTSGCLMSSFRTDNWPENTCKVVTEE